MSVSSKYRKLLSGVKKSPVFWSQIAKRDFTEDLLRWMNDRGLSQTELAEKLGVTPQFVTKVLRTNANLTIETMTKFANVLGCQLRVHLADKHAVTNWFDRPANTTRFAWAGNVVPIDQSKITRAANYSAEREPGRMIVNGK